MAQGRWLTLYYRDEKKVMRAIKGIKIIPGEVVYLDQSVYTLTSSLGNRYWMDVE